MASLQPLERNEIQSLSTSPSTVYKSPYQTPDTTITIQATDDSAMSSSQRRKDLQQIAKRILPLYFFLSATMVFSPLVMVLYLLLRLLLLIKHGHDYYSVTQLKLCIRFCLFTLIGMVALNFGIGQKIPYHGKDYFPEITKALSRLPAGLYFQVSGICFFSCFLPSIICFFIPYQIPLEHMRSRLYVREGLLEIIDCVLFWWIESKVAKYVPPLEDYKILGLQIQKWIKVSICVIIAYNVFALFCHFILWALRMLVPKTRKLVSGRTDTRISQLTVIENFTANKIYLVYCFNGMKHSITFILSSLVLLLTWVIYFGSHFDGTPRAKNVLEFVTWTFVSVLICSLLWLIKTCVLLSWEVNVVYKKLGSQIIKGGNQLYLLGIIGRRSHDIFKLRYKARRNQVSQDDKQVEVKEVKLSGTVREGRDDDEEENMKTPLRSNVTTQSVSNKRKPFNKQLTQVLTIFNYPMSLGDRSKSKQDDEDDWTEQEVSNSKSSNDKGGNQQGKHYNVMVKQDDEDDCTKQEVSNLKSSNDKGDNQGGKHYNVMMKLSTQVKERVKDELLFLQDNHIPAIDVIQQVAQYLLTARKTLLIETYTSDILHSFHKNRVFNENDIKQLIEGRNNEANGKMKNEWDYFRDQLDSEEFSPETIGAWMDRARTNCLFLANTLSSAEEVADCLDKIISLLLIAATFILWLLLTGMATTKALVLIASPIIAATYIFGDTSKALFQGIIFTYLVHPFDVGDVCIIDKKMMEVKTMGVWKTIFSKVDTQEEVIYANSQLATKDIIKDINNHNWNDFVEIDVTPLYKKEIIKLERKIRRYLNNNQQKFRSGHNFVAVSTTGDDIKISISFRHNVNPKKTTATASAECLKEKLKLRAKFVLHVLDILKKIKKERSKLELNKRRKFQWQLNKPSQSN